MPHLHNQAGQHDLTISAFIVRTDRSEPAAVLHEHRKISKLLQFGGHVELDETPWQGLVREIREESGYGYEQLTILQPPGSFLEKFPGTAGHPIPFYFNTHAFTPERTHFHADLTYAVLVEAKPAHHIIDGESAAIHWFTAAQLRALPSNQIHDQTRSNALFVIEHLMHEWEPVPASSWPI